MTLTLPESTLQALALLDRDRSRAIVKAVDASAGGARAAGRASVELVEVAPGAALIVVGPSDSLRNIPWLKLVEIAPSRHVLVVPEGTRPEVLELALLDQIEALPATETYERGLLGDLRALIRSLRQDRRIGKSELIVVSLPRHHRARRPGSRAHNP